MPQPEQCPMCGHEGQDFTKRRTVWRECPNCGEVFRDPSAKLPYEELPPDPPIQGLGEMLTIAASIQAIFLLAILMGTLAAFSVAGVIYSAGGLAVTACQMFGSWSMALQKRYSWSVAAALMGLLPLTFMWFMSAPLGVWALCLLSMPQTRKSFS